MSGILRHGTTAHSEYSLVITPESAGWAFSGLRILELLPGGSHAFDSGEDELIVLPLNGSCTVTVDGERFVVEGREDVFSAVSDFVYAPRDARVEVASDGGGRFAFSLPAPIAASRRATRRPARCRSSCAAPARRAGR